jgi:hypothetical protein
VPFQCPNCSLPRSLRIAATIELPPDSRWDEISLQVVRCGACNFAGLAVYEESRRGALDSEIVHHSGYYVQDEDLKNFAGMIQKCPEPANRRCDCSTHHKLGKQDAYGIWDGLSETQLGLSFNMKLG